MTMLLHRTTNKEVVEALPKGRAFLTAEMASLNTMSTTVKGMGIVSDECS